MRNRWQTPTPIHSLSLLLSLTPSLSLLPLSLIESHMNYLSQCWTFTFQHTLVCTETGLFCNNSRDNMNTFRLNSFRLWGKSLIFDFFFWGQRYIFHHSPWGEHVCACGFPSSFLNLSAHLSLQATKRCLSIYEGSMGWGSHKSVTSSQIVTAFNAHIYW